MIQIHRYPILEAFRILAVACLVFLGLAAGPLSRAGAQEGAPRETALAGTVKDAVSGEPIARARVATIEPKRETESGPDGRFRLVVPAAAEVELQAGTVGYAMVKLRVQPSAGQETEVSIELSPEASLRRSDKVTVTAAVFEPVESGVVLERTLNYSELKNMASVLIDDPLRSVQGLPGVATGDDFNAQFSVRGDSYSHVGLYLDGVLTYMPFHTVQNIQDGGSMTILNGDLVESVSLLSSAAPARFGDRTSSALSVYTRPGSADRAVYRVAAGVTGVSATAEGPLHKSRKVTGLVSARKSYTDYIVNRLADDINYVIGLWDVQGKLSWQPAENHQVFLTALWGDSGLNRDRWIERLGMNSLLRGESKSGIGNLQWNWTPSHDLVLQSRAYLTDDRGRNWNRYEETLYRSGHRQWSAGTDAAWEWKNGSRLEFGVQGRRLGESGLERVYDYGLSKYLVQSRFSGTGWQNSGYGQVAWSLLDRRLNLTVGGRGDHFQATGESLLLPRAGLTANLGRRLSVSAGFGQYGQYPSWAYLLGEHTNSRLRAERSTHYVTGLEYQMGERTRLRLDGYWLQERRNIFAPEAEYRLVNGKPAAPSSTARWENLLSGHSRGVEAVLQRRSVNRLSGWLSYSYGITRMRDNLHRLTFPLDFDQRHTVNLYGSYRLRQTVNLSAKYRYGSNFPIIGFFRTQGGKFYLAESRNQLRTPAYSRLDFRINKAFFYPRWKLTLYFEVVNLLNRENMRYTGIDRVYMNTGQVTLQKNTLFPVLPTAGLLFEF